MNTIVAFHHPSKNKNLWVVSILENDSVCKYCKSAYSAMRYMFLLQSSSADLYISDNCLQRLSFEIALHKRDLACRIQQHAKAISEIYDIRNHFSP
jgi:hypothetical protein